jgi:hypothetical protein
MKRLENASISVTVGELIEFLVATLIDPRVEKVKHSAD